MTWIQNYRTNIGILIQAEISGRKKLQPLGCQGGGIAEGKENSCPEHGILPTCPQLSFWHRTEVRGSLIYRESNLSFSGNMTLWWNALGCGFVRLNSTFFLCKQNLQHYRYWRGGKYVLRSGISQISKEKKKHLIFLWVSLHLHLIVHTLFLAGAMVRAELKTQHPAVLQVFASVPSQHPALCPYCSRKEGWDWPWAVGHVARRGM